MKYNNNINISTSTIIIIIVITYIVIDIMYYIMAPEWQKKRRKNRNTRIYDELKIYGNKSVFSLFLYYYVFLYPLLSFSLISVGVICGGFLRK